MDSLSNIGLTALKTFFSAMVLFALTRFMGKKQISQLTFFDYAVGISIGSVAAVVSVDNSLPVVDGIVSMAVWAALPVIFSMISISSIRARRFIDSTPMVLIQQGKIIERNLRRVKFTVNDLLEELRVQGIFDVSQVEFSVLEANGKLSVLKKAAQQTATLSDLNLPYKEQGIQANIIIDGRMIKENMLQINVGESWLKSELEKQGVRSVRDVLLATYSNGRLYIDRKNSDPKDLKVFQ